MAGDYKSSIPPGARAGADTSTTFVEVRYDDSQQGVNDRPKLSTVTPSGDTPIKDIPTPY